MQAADIAIGLRRRSPWEAMDLGLTMLQRWWRSVYVPHLLFATPLMALAIAGAWTLERAWVAVLVIWWLKPAYDRVVLHVLSRAVFGELPTTRAVFGAAREWLGASVIGALLWRPSLTRSFSLPVRQLEGQTGREGRERRAVLGRRIGSYAVWLTFTCLILESFVLSTSFGMLAELFLPAKADEGVELYELFFGGGEGQFITFSDAFAYAAAVLVLEPFYVAAGFGLYLNRRTLLEGWDIEVALRRIAARHAAALLFCLLFGMALVMPGEARAQEKKPKEEIARVLEAKEFGYFRDVKRWQYRGGPDEAPRKGGWDLGWLRGVGYALARAGEVLMWIAAGALLAYAIWWAARMLPAWRRPAPEPYRPPAALFGMDLAPEKLPADVGAAAAALAREGRLREALGLLYRGALSELVHKRGVQLLVSHTEGEAVRLARMPYFGLLVDAWLLCAYARRMPQAADVLRLADDYKAAFA
jgi:hypothetical protein